MGKVASFRLEGVECWFYSQDHRPPHFHARKRGQWHVRVFFLEPRECMMERVPGERAVIGGADRKALGIRAEQHRGELLKEWEEKVSHD